MLVAVFFLLLFSKVKLLFFIFCFRGHLYIECSLRLRGEMYIEEAVLCQRLRLNVLTEHVGETIQHCHKEEPKASSHNE